MGLMLCRGHGTCLIFLWSRRPSWKKDWREWFYLQCSQRSAVRPRLPRSGSVWISGRFRFELPPMLRPRFGMKFGRRGLVRITCGSLATGTVRVTSGPGPPGAGNSPANVVRPGSSQYIGKRAEPTATIPLIGPTRRWKKARTTAATTTNTATGMTTTVAMRKTVRVWISQGSRISA